MVKDIFLIFFNPPVLRWIPRRISLTTALNFSKSSFLAVRNLYRSKNGMTFWSRSFNDRTQKRYKSSWWLSDRRLMKTDPQPKKFLISSRALRLLAPWVTTNSGNTCQPDFVVWLRKMLTKKLPSPSTNPTIQCLVSSLSCWLSVFETFLLGIFVYGRSIP